MAAPPLPPVAVRIVRPYETEESFLESELETVGKTSIILIGAHSRPAGVILRFEVTLSNGNTIMRGEGRVLAYKESAFRGQPGLALRFTRLDPKSKALVDRAAAIRDARLASDSIRPSARPLSIPPPLPTAAVPNDPAVAQILASPTPAAPAVTAEATPEEASPETATAASSAPPPEPGPVSAPPPVDNAPRHEEVAAAATLATPVEGAPPAVSPPDDRESILARLRKRAGALSDDEKATIVRPQR